MLERLLLVATVVAAVAAPGAPTAARATATAAPESESGPAAQRPDPFPLPEIIRDHELFWGRVFSEWSLGQVAVHDLEHPGVVYDVVDLPGPAGDQYTPAQREFVEALAELWQDRLSALAEKARKRRRLSRREKTWALAITTTVGTHGVDTAHERVRTQRGLRERFRRGLEISRRYEGAMRQIFREHGLPEDLAYLPHVESSFQAHARSSANAVGIWQFTRGTGRRFLTVDAALDERLDPIVATTGAARYLAHAFERLGDWPIALTSYNHGLAGMGRAVELHGPDYEAIFLAYRSRSFGFASKNFYAEFLAARRIARDPGDYFPEGLRFEEPLPLDRIELEAPSNPGRVALAFRIPVDELASLNPAWTSRAVRSDLTLPRGSTVWLPSGHLATLSDAGHDPDYALRRGGIHVVRRGESLSEIAHEHGTTVARLRRLNGLPAREDLIRVGQRLHVDASGPEFHTVQRGDTLSDIAARYGVSVNDLRGWNGRPATSSLIRVGQRLRVAPAGASDVHIVRRGESLSRIARDYRVSLLELLDHNRLSMGSVIHPGQAIRIPLR